MAKTADKYFAAAPWEVIEEGFNESYARVAESVYSLGNEYMGIRGFFEEGYSGETLIGSYFNGIYERQKVAEQGYVGIIHHTEFMVNSVNWLYTRIFIDGEMLDLHTGKFFDFRRVLNLKEGTLTRSFVWVTKEGKELEIEFERFLSMEDATKAGQKISIKARNFEGTISLISGLDFSEIHHMASENLWMCDEPIGLYDSLSITGTTVNTGQKVNSFCRFFSEEDWKREIVKEEKFIGMRFEVNVERGKTAVLKKLVCNTVCNENNTGSYKEFNDKLNSLEEDSKEWDYEKLLDSSKDWWKKTWQDSDIVIHGDDLNQQGIRYCIFQMHQTYHGTKPGTNIGAKGLTGEAYSGNAFWDTETYCLPFYLFHNINAAKNLLMFRYMTLKEAKKRAKDLDCQGAFYPIATISGRECCSLWQHASLQLQASTAVAYGVWIYERITKDTEFVYQYGLPMLIEISRMLASRGDYNADGTSYGYYGVMGPDEFQMMVNNNCYTNYIGRFTLLYTLDTLSKLKEENRERYEKLQEEFKLTHDEYTRWKKITEDMYIPYDETSKLFEQHEGYFRLPHIDIDKIPMEEFPLYHHWSYDRIYRNDMIKQPDVLMFLLLFNSAFSEEQIKANYEFYEPRCIHESSLSPSVHSILASQLKKHSEAYEFFGFATRMDLDNYNRNTHEGLHTTSIAAAWMNIVYGFGGLRADGEILSFTPSIPNEWDAYSFRICYVNDVILAEVEKDKVAFQTLHGNKIKVRIYGDVWELSDKKVWIDIPKEWRG